MDYIDVELLMDEAIHSLPEPESLKVACSLKNRGVALQRKADEIKKTRQFLTGDQW